MSPQPIPKTIQQNNPNFGIKSFNTLLIDGSSLLEICFYSNKSQSKDGKNVGAVIAFFVQMKILLNKGNFRYVYVFWDGNQSGSLRYALNSEYKANRDKDFSSVELSDYMKAVNQKIAEMQESIYKPKKAKTPNKTKEEIESFFYQREIIIECLEELCVRQCLCDTTEADDFIGYYVNHKKAEENIVIFSNDKDLTQLIHKSSFSEGKDDVIVAYKPQRESVRFINSRNHKDLVGYNYQNVVLKKIICGDASDNIKGIKGVGEKTLLTHFPEIKERKVSLSEVIEKAQQINEQRISEKKKPYQWATNIVNRVTDGVQGKKIYEINEKIIDLTKPLMTKESEELLDSIMYAPMDVEDRTIDNLYNIIVKYGISELFDMSKFSNLFVEFKFLKEKEKKLL